MKKELNGCMFSGKYPKGKELGCSHYEDDECLCECHMSKLDELDKEMGKSAELVGKCS